MPGPTGAYAPGGIYWWSGLINDADFQRLSPETQATLKKYFQQSREPGNFLEKMQTGLANDPALAAAVEEAKANGALNHPEGPWQRFAKYAGLAVVGGAIAAPLLAGAAGPSATTAAGTTAGTVGGLGGATAGAAGATGAGMAGAFSAANILRYGLPVAGEVASMWWQQRQADKAAGREIDMSREALALEEKMFERELQERERDRTEDTRRNDRDFEERRRLEERDYQTGERAYADLGPYRNIGTGALSRLAFGVGIPDPNEGVSRGTSSPTAPPPVAPGATPVQPWNTGTMGQIPGGSLNGLAGAANVSGGGMTTMRTPTGQTVLVPASKVQEAIANGGTVLQGAA